MLQSGIALKSVVMPAGHTRAQRVIEQLIELTNEQYRVAPAQTCINGASRNPVVLSTSTSQAHLGPRPCGSCSSKQRRLGVVPQWFEASHDRRTRTFRLLAGS